jgi:hypothetical protein
MPVIEFGAGLLYSTPNAGNLPVDPSPTRLLLQEVQIDFKGDLKKLFTQYQMPIATARGKLDITGKAKIVDYDPDPINQLFWAQSIAVGMQLAVDQETDTPTGASVSVQVQNNVNFAQNNGVFYSSGTKAGAILLQAPAGTSQGSLTTGLYTVCTTTGTYTFSTADNNIAMSISYTFTNATRGKTITLANQVMGYAPVCAVDMWGTFRSKYLGIRLNSCTFGSWTYPSKLEDFWVSDVSFDANADASNNIGYIFADTF